MFTPKQHKQIAELLKKKSIMIYGTFGNSEYIDRQQVVGGFVDIFETDNPSFDYAKFIADCIPEGKEWDHLR